MDDQIDLTPALQTLRDLSLNGLGDLSSLNFERSHIPF